MSKREKQTSFRLSEEENLRYKKLAEEKGITFNKLVRDALASAHANPDFLNPIKPPKESNKILQGLKEALKERYLGQESMNQELMDRLERLELKVDSMMSKLKVEQPTEDKSGKKVFE